MRNLVILLLSLGLVGAYANAIPKQTDSNNKTSHSDSETKHNEETEKTLNNVSEQKGVDADSIVDKELFDDDKVSEVSIAIEENSEDLADNPVSTKFFGPSKIYNTDFAYSVPEKDDFFRSNVPASYRDEMMAMAASFAPVPLFKRHRQKARRRFSTPRHFIRNPYRRFYFYPYHTYYYPRPIFY
ncbi:uncharacterized protein [Choristoneura fumiferana]|uniref:uncharacterized protein n=1 Tax=Choristoneura fumiferana TaxID=7141 RepID=UPI003D1562F3